VSAVFDSGLQPERTLLAWRRTCLSFGLASAVMVRFSVGPIGTGGVLLGLVGIGLAASSYAAVARRYRRAHESLISHGELVDGAAPLLLVWLAALMFGAACIAFVLLRTVM
jgi:uncharacterized membrane protein YidH (DUF202 family)